MTVNRYYSSAAVATSLAAPVADSALSLQVNSLTGYPSSYPYTIIVDEGTSSAEVMTVTEAAGTVLTVTRGADGTTALSHALGATVRHGVSARDFKEPQEHMDSTTAHGATGAVVGTTNTQTLTNKTLTTPSISAPVITGGGSWAGGPTLSTPVITSFASANHTHATSAGGGFITVPRCRLERLAVVNLTSGTATTITPDNSAEEEGGDWWSSGNSIAVPVNGWYTISIRGVFKNAGTNTGVRQMQLLRVADDFPAVSQTNVAPGASATDWVDVQGTDQLKITAGQTFYLVAKQTSGGALELASASVSFVLNARF